MPPGFPDAVALIRQDRERDDMTFRELKEAFESAKYVITAFEAAIDVGRA